MTAMETVTDLLLEIMEVTYRFTPCLRIEPCYNLTRQWLEVCWSFFVNVRVMWKKICHASFSSSLGLNQNITLFKYYLKLKFKKKLA